MTLLDKTILTQLLRWLERTPIEGREASAMVFVMQLIRTELEGKKDHGNQSGVERSSTV